MSELQKKKKRGLPIALFHGLLTLFGACLTVSMLIINNVGEARYSEINAVTDGYIECTKDIEKLDEASDYLTSKVRSYLVMGNEIDAIDYMKEIANAQTRETSVEHIKFKIGDTQVYAYLKDALKQSNLLANIEIYALRLAGDAYGLDKLPKAIQIINLKEEDATLTKEQKKDKAVRSVFDENYLSIKTKIDQDVDDALSELILFTNSKKDVANQELKVVMVSQGIIGLTMLAILLSFGVISYFLVLRPLKESKRAIESNQPIEEHGCREIRFVSSSYNKMYEAEQKQKDALQYEVSHDILTAIPNRHEYVSVCNKLAHDEVYFALADVDKFKSINDDNGHSVGDAVLCEVARRLQEAFLHHDRVFRIGGDEFAIISTDVSLEKEKELVDVLNEINHTLQQMHDKKHFPFVSLSFGIAKKSKDMSFEEVYRNADKALYKAKAAGRHSVVVEK